MFLIPLSQTCVRVHTHTGNAGKGRKGNARKNPFLNTSLVSVEGNPKFKNEIFHKGRKTYLYFWCKLTCRWFQKGRKVSFLTLCLLFTSREAQAVISPRPPLFLKLWNFGNLLLFLFPYISIYLFILIFLITFTSFFCRAVTKVLRFLWKNDNRLTIIECLLRSIRASYHLRQNYF